MAAASSEQARSFELAQGSVIVFSGNALGRALGFLYQFLLARVLGASGYGIFLLGLSIVSLTAAVADGGLRWGVLRWASMAWGRGDRAEVKGTILAGAGLGLGGGLIAGFAVALGGWVWAASWFRQPDLSWLLPWLALSIPAIVLTTLMTSGLQALRQFTEVTLLLHGLDPALRVLVFSGLSLAGWHLGGAVGAHLLAGLVTTAGAFYWLRWRSPALSPEVLPRYAVGPLLVFSFPLLLSNVTGFILQWADTLIIGAYLSAREVGVYGAAVRLATLAAMFLSAVSAVFAPQIYALFGERNLAEVGRLYRQSTRWLIALGFPVFLFTILNSRQLLALFGPEFIEGRWALVLLAVATLVVGGTGAAGDVVLMVGRSRPILWASLLVGATAIALNLWLVPRYGIVGAAFATGGALVLGNLINLLQAWWLTGLQPYHLAMLCPVFLALPVAAVQWGVVRFLDGPDPFMIGAAALTWLLVYPVVLVRLGLEADDRALWGRIVALARPRAGSL